MRKLLPLLIIVFLGIDSLAQNNNRLLNQPVSPRSIQIKVTADLFIATSFIEMEFYNPNNVEMEGLYYFNLNPGQAITAFQLDLNGKFRDGTIEDRGKASAAYNAVVGKRIDPALLQMQSPNVFSLNIYPIAPGSSRKITMTIQQLLKAEGDLLQYFLPLKSSQGVETFFASIKINNSDLQPFIAKGLLKGQSFISKAQTHEIEWKAVNIDIDRGLAFSIPLNRQGPIVCTKKMDGRTFFACRYPMPVSKKFMIHPEKITVYWDVSINASRRDYKIEMDFLKQFLAAHDISALKVITFNQKIKETRQFDLKNKDEQQWDQFINSLTYEGAAQFGNLDFSKESADQIFIFSSGWNSYGNDKPLPGRKQVYCIHATYNPDWPHLMTIIGKTGGNYIDLTRTPLQTAVKLASEASNNLVEVRSLHGNVILDKDWTGFTGNEVLITGSIQGESDELQIDFGNDERINGREKLVIHNNPSCEGSVIERLGALAIYDSCVKTYDWSLVRNYGILESIVTPYTSFIVLERIEDYVRYNIKPPKKLEEECGVNPVVKQQLELQKEMRAQTEKEILAAVVRNYNQRINWWDRNQAGMDFDSREEKVVFNKMEDSKYKSFGTPNRGFSGSVPTIVTGSRFNSDATLSEVVVTSMGITRPPRELGYSVSRSWANELIQARPVNLQNGLTGKVSGLNVQTTNSGVFGDTRITLRGIRSLTGNNQPLLILDGSVLPLSLINSINPNDILDVTILKSPSATAIYGPDGANGALFLRTKKGKDTRYNYSGGVYRLKDCDEMDYIIEISKYPPAEKMTIFKKLELRYGHYAGFYFDMAQHFFDAGLRTEAMNILFSATGMGNGERASSRAMAYTLETWKMYPQAIEVYSHLLQNDSADIHAWRDLALAHYQNGNYQEAVNLLYAGVTRNWGDLENKLVSWKTILLQEMNAIISNHASLLDISGINTELIKPIPVDLRISVQCNKEGKNSITILTPHREDLNAMKTSSALVPNDFQVKKARKGKYTIRANYFDWNDHSPWVPTFYKIVSFKNFGSRNQTIEIENVIMDNQSGLVDIGEVKWR